MQFSIIIPVYNVENYLKKGVESVLQQTFIDFELILVDDGSKDNSLNLCYQLQKIDNRIQVIAKENGGASDARNVGINAAKGEYIMFLDSDDYWDDTEALNKIATTIQSKPETELLLFHWKNLNLKNNQMIVFPNQYDEQSIRLGNREEVIKSLFNSDLFPSSAVITVTKRTFLLENNLFFTKGIKAEDVDWTLQVITKANHFLALNLNCYVVLLHREGSVTSTADAKSIDSVLYILDKWTPVFLKNETEVNKLLLGHLAFHYATCFITYNQLSKSEQKNYLSKLKKYLFLFNYSHNPKTSIVKKLIASFGVNTGSKIIGLLFSLRKRIRK
ncbi:glycosyltransferase family 2 protein [Flavobacterium sp.]|mgnify:FL=1|uniref:glycosyltransferase family 2 protein n=1 Tax=Flavobacterium sp. TaxID=239 RepID=UPI0035B32773